MYVNKCVFTHANILSVFIRNRIHPLALRVKGTRLNIIETNTMSWNLYERTDALTSEIFNPIWIICLFIN